MKDSIKKVIESDGRISMSYKKELAQWYGEIKIFRLFCNDLNGFEYIVELGIWKKFNNIDDAVNYFCYHAYTSKNIGYVQNRLQDKGLIGDMDDDAYEFPDEKLLKLIKEESKLVDAEALKQGIAEPKQENISVEDASKELKEIIPTLTIDNIPEKLSTFKKKFLNLDPYLSMSAVYWVVSGKYEYRASGNISSWTRERIKEAKESENANLKFNRLELTAKFKEDYERYDISV